MKYLRNLLHNDMFQSNHDYGPGMVKTTLHIYGEWKNFYRGPSTEMKLKGFSELKLEAFKNLILPETVLKGHSLYACMPIIEILER